MKRVAFGESGYRMSKCAVQALAETAALELACYGIRVNTVSPGLTNSSNFLRGAIDPIMGDEKRREGLRIPE